MSDEIETNSEPLDKDPHPDHAPLTWGEVRKAQQAARRKIALQKIDDEEFERAEEEERKANPPPPAKDRLTANLTEELAELVHLGPLNLPPDRQELRIDNVIYRNGWEGDVPAAVARDLIYMEMKGWEVEEVITHGKDRYAFNMQQKRAQQGAVHVTQVRTQPRVSPPGA